MQNKVMLHIRNPFLLDASTYTSTALMALLGVSGLPNLALQIAALALCLLFALLYRFLFRTGWYERNPVIYFGAQVVVLTLLLLLRSDTSDAFNFLFYILTVHTAVVLPLRRAVVWTVLYFVIDGVAVLLNRGTEGLYAIFFYLAAFVVCFIFGYTVQQTELTSERNQVLVDELQATQQKLRELAVLAERNRLARELHDSVKQQVFAISMQLSAARASLVETDKAYTPVVQAERLAQQAGAELTTLIHELRPPGLEHRDLSTALQDHVAEWSRLNGVEVEMNIQENLSAPLPVEQALFRVAQEALSNVARHSGASRVSVRLAGEGQDVVLTIEDDGLGFDFDNTVKGVGLDSMSERLESVGGKLEFSSQGRQGTRLIARVRRL